MTRNLLVLFSLALTTYASANGGGYRFGTKLTGSLTPFQPEGTEHIQIVEEHLQITLGKSAANVAVRYRMRNLADRKVSVRFGFPVEVVHQPFGSWGTTSKSPESETALYCRDYVVGADGKQIRHRYILEPFAFKKIDPFPGSDVLEGIEGWMVSKLDFKKGQEREVTIHYTSQYDIANYFISSRGTKGAAKFVYRLSTGGVWGGPIAKGTITIRTQDIFHEEVVIKSPADRFRKLGEEWRWEFENLEPTLADDINIEAIPGSLSYSTESDEKSLTYTERLGIWNAVHRDFTATASSSLDPENEVTYGPENIINRDIGSAENPLRAWSEGVDGDGVGEFLDIAPKTPAPLSWIEIRNGYGESKELFAANNRIKTLTVTLNGEHSFDTDLVDTRDHQKVFVRGYDLPVKSIRLTIKSIYPGKHFQDTCITDVNLARRLAKKPEIRGSR